MATRRAVLTGLALGLGIAATRSAFGQPAENAALVAVETSVETGLSRARFLSASGASLQTLALDFRAHGMARHGAHLVVFPRRPGNRFAIVESARLEILGTVTAPPERHFYGHGAYSRDGATLLVTENNLETLQGGIGVYEAAAPFRRLGEIALPGAGPHEIIRAPGRDRFFVALGGLETHPEYGRTPLNLGRFESRIVRLDLGRGHVEPMGRWPGSAGISLRHMALDASGTLFAGGQVADPARARSAHVLWRCRDGQAEILEAGGQLGGYVSSLASASGGTLVTSKTAHRALLLHDGRVARTVTLDGASAAAMGPGLSAVAGHTELQLGAVGLAASPGHEFDNHAIAL